MPVLSSTEQELLLDLYDRWYQEQQAENRAVGGSSSSDGVELRPLPGGLDWTDRPEPLGPCGLGPSSAGATTDRPEPLGPCGLGPSSANTMTARPRALGPCGLVPSNPVGSEGVPGKGNEAGGLRTPVPQRVGGQSRLPLDRFSRPRGTKQSVLLSSRGDDLAPFIFLTQNGACAHSSTSCRPMQFAGLPVQRSICRYCFPSGELPSRKNTDGTERIICFTRSGHYIHADQQCRCLDSSEEVQFRKLCRCCRWTG